MTALALIIPDALKAAADTLSQHMRWADEGCPSYTIPCAPTKSGPATHWGLHITNPLPSFVAMIQSAQQGHMPDELAQAGYPAETFAAIMGALLTGTQGFDALCEEHGLVKVTDEVTP